MLMKENAIYEFERFCLDGQERLLLRDGKQVELTAKVFDMLLALVENGGRLLTKHELMEKVWPGDHVEDHNLKVTIAMLRKTLGPDQNGMQYIETVPKKGYRFLGAVQISSKEITAGHPRNTEITLDTVPVTQDGKGPTSDPPGVATDKPDSDLAACSPSEPAQKLELEGLFVPSLRSRKWAWVSGSVVLLLAAVTFIMQLSNRRWVARIHPLGSKPLTDDGRAKGNLHTDGTTLYFTETQGFRTILVSAPMSGTPIHEIKTPFTDVWLQDLSSNGKTLLITSVEGPRRGGRLWTIPASAFQMRP
jgi:DNA-binding winged helix-turn-helix (wHTH) protein